MCGEQEINSAYKQLHEGSPPRVRGTGSAAFFSKNHSRITPACAGNRNGCMSPSLCWQDHPRVCGEQLTSLSFSFFAAGSPPRVRGTVHPLAAMGLQGGITPACAGNSSHKPCCHLSFQDHPRVCGEQFLAYPPKQRYKGSPPRVRGTAFGFPIDGSVGGITPACAGNSRALRVWLEV